MRTGVLAYPTGPDAILTSALFVETRGGEAREFLLEARVVPPFPGWPERFEAEEDQADNVALTFDLRYSARVEAVLAYESGTDVPVPCSWRPAEMCAQVSGASGASVDVTVVFAGDRGRILWSGPLVLGPEADAGDALAR